LAIFLIYYLFNGEEWSASAQRTLALNGT